MSELEVFTCEQGTPEWYAARLGIPTASEFATVMAKGEGKVRRDYMLKLAGEVITGEPMETYSNDHMKRGQQWEDEARELYAFQTELQPERVGFIKRGPMGCSPDALIGASGGVEIKTKLAHLQIDCLLRDAIPPAHRAQTQGILLVTEREWIDVAIYSRKLPLFVKRAFRDEPYIHAMHGEIDRFNDELAEIVHRIRRYGEVEAVAA